MRRAIALLLLVQLALCAASCAAQPAQQEEGDYVVYLLADRQSAAGADAIRPVRTDLDVAEDAPLVEKAEAVVNRVLAGGGSLWQGIELRSIAIQGRRAYVDLSRRYAGLTGIQLSLAGLAPGHVQLQAPGLQVLVLPGDLGVFRLALFSGHFGISSHCNASFLLIISANPI